MRKLALPLLSTGVESPAESALRLLILQAGFEPPEVSCPVDVGDREFRCDLGYRRQRIAIEYEGAYHYEGGTEQARRDIARHEAMRAAGWIVLLVTAHDLRDPRSFLARLESSLVARA